MTILVKISNYFSRNWSKPFFFWLLSNVTQANELNLTSWTKLFVNFKRVEPELKKIVRVKLEPSFELNQFLSNRIEFRQVRLDSAHFQPYHKSIHLICTWDHGMTSSKLLHSSWNTLQHNTTCRHALVVSLCELEVQEHFGKSQ